MTPSRVLSLAATIAAMAISPAVLPSAAADPPPTNPPLLIEKPTEDEAAGLLGQTPRQCRYSGNSFYEAPATEDLPAKLGSLIRCKKHKIKGLKDASAYRVMYTTETPDGSPRASTGLIFVPNQKAPKRGRKVVAWSHGTVGLGAKCAPSRSLKKISPTGTGSFEWINSMLARNWVVAATDYIGLGTKGPNAGSALYLVGNSGAIDTINSVRAARNLNTAKARKTYAVYGHSQGGQSSLFVGSVAKSYAPSLKLKGVAAADPAAEVVAEVNQVWDQGIGWVIGPPVVLSWPAANPSLDPTEIVSEAGLKRYRSLAKECIGPASLAGLADRLLFGSFFVANPMNNPDWARFAAEQVTPRITAVPVFIGQNTADGVVLANTIAKLQVDWCSAPGKQTKLKMNWVKEPEQSFLKSLSIHADAAAYQAPAVIKWINKRFKNKSAPSSCGSKPPVAPAGG
ncbi:MAG: lipase family protein [Actinomycetia bacterium]|nr:lipase family protein [Actinomycetes bacterium]MCH9800045.1 lipase family protein [Actinomycetes bacterium]